jgi:hypothetical protein
MGVVKGKRTTPKVNWMGAFVLIVMIYVIWQIIVSIGVEDWEQAQFWALTMIVANTGWAAQERLRR